MRLQARLFDRVGAFFEAGDRRRRSALISNANGKLADMALSVAIVVASVDGVSAVGLGKNLSRLLLVLVLQSRASAPTRLIE